ncbi:TetR family transcriptional regulator [Isoptericola jiangsuensis]|uniref:TetR family transcriptional regulator n=1 Tax=Isoptericola jiangsuensis TaxID=548579 RepID=A0A2A9ES37_9MICO|nr:TetR/AcrR family transcriptional regulator [Isoptericola jiangsuensis]PFG41824.1 TetR family transcriptional regulator [Isoptericola jiangsuensis]
MTVATDGQQVRPRPDGRSTRWDDHRAQRRAALVREARRAVHELGPGASMDDIAAIAGTSKSIFYRYFDDKAGLRLAVAEAVVRGMHRRLAEAAAEAPSPHAALRAMVRTYLQTIESSPHVYWFVTRTAIGGNESDDGRTEALGAYLDSVITLVAEPFAQAAGVPPTTAAAWASGAVGFVRGSGEWWLGHSRAEGLTRDELVEQVTTWLWTGPVGVLHHDDAATRRTPDTPGTPETEQES